MAFLAFTFFAIVMGAAMATMIATIRPQFSRIFDLLVHGPVAVDSVPVRVAARSHLRDVRISPVRRRSPAAALRAAA